MRSGQTAATPACAGSPPTPSEKDQVEAKNKAALDLREPLWPTQRRFHPQVGRLPLNLRPFPFSSAQPLFCFCLLQGYGEKHWKGKKKKKKEAGLLVGVIVLRHNVIIWTQFC